MTIPSERQERDLKTVEAEIANWHRVIGRFGSSTDVEKHQLTKLEAERDRLLQSSGGEVSEAQWLANMERQRPAMESAETEFFDELKRRKPFEEAFVSAGYGSATAEGLVSILADAGLLTAPLPSTPAEPNPPGSGEPVAWQYKLNDGWWAWPPVKKTDAEYISKTLELKIRPLYAAPLPSPSEGAGDEGPIIDALHKAFIAAGHTSPDGTWIAAGTNSVIATVLRTFRTRATATGGGDNG